MTLSSSRAMDVQFTDQSKLHQDVDNVRKFLFDQYIDQTNVNQRHSYMKHYEQSHVKVPQEHFSASMNPSIMRNHINSGGFTSFDNLSVGSGFASPRLGSRSPAGNLSPRQNLAATSNLPNYSGIRSPTTASAHQMPVDPLYVQFLRTAELAALAANYLGGTMDANSIPSLLEEFKRNKSKSYELSEIAGHVVEFSTEEKDMVFSEIMPQASTLMTDVFGNYVVQKFFEHGSTTQIKELADQLIGRVLALSLQMYGCRVIQKHVQEHGKPHERSAIVEKLIGQIVQMSQQKFASNVIEKCLAFGNPVERQILIGEMLGSSNESEHLEVMMKDQFANYVVQKVLETCDDQQREMILTRIKGHLNTLKKYTYGKHIVARVEKLVAAGGMAYYLVRTLFQMDRLPHYVLDD
ncbi:hypothetical protein GUJ93_ZPchr0001g31553 [Zizania palustris]|uniref:PUM-HD domain-containing protein n=1 Tax=Zizania palustris TaxID=103762 RepID=A0A8J5VTA7_ZIZPA|nr:hypothetical protein GUJ93_ZPchr0001g31553 [Zizania palustris]